MTNGTNSTKSKSAQRATASPPPPVSDNNHPPREVHVLREALFDVRVTVEERLAGQVRSVANINGAVLLLHLLMIPTLGLVVFFVNATGLRVTMPLLATPLSEMPFPLFEYLADSEFSYRWDLACLISLVMLVCVCWFLVETIRIVFAGRLRFANPLWPTSLFSIAAVVTLADACLFFTGLRYSPDSPWGISFFTPLIATIAYTCLLATLALWQVILEEQGD